MTAGRDEFRLSPEFRVLAAVMSVFLVVVGTVAAVAINLSGGAGGFELFWMLWLAGVLGQGWWLNFRMPHRIELHDAGLRFVAVTRVVEVPWDRLRSIYVPLYDVARHTMVWRWDGGRLHTWRKYDGVDRLVRIVEERAPGAKILL